MRRLLLVRHGRTAWNADDRAQGHIDVPLDEVGQAQAKLAAAALADLAPTRLWSSDLGRARQTAAYVEETTGLTAVTDERLREYDLGERSGLTRTEFAARFPAEYAAWMADVEEPQVEGAESIAQVGTRMLDALTEALAEVPDGETGVVITHGACLRVGLVALLRWPAEVGRSLRGMDNCRWADVRYDDERGRLRLAAYNAGPEA